MIVANECTQMPGQSLASAVVVSESSRPVLEEKKISTMNVFGIRIEWKCLMYVNLNGQNIHTHTHSNIDNDTISCNLFI